MFHLGLSFSLPHIVNGGGKGKKKKKNYWRKRTLNQRGLLLYLWLHYLVQIPNLHSPGCLLWINPTSFRSGFTFLVKFLFFNQMKHLIFVDELSCLSQSYPFKLCCPTFNYFEPLFGSTSSKK